MSDEELHEIDAADVPQDDVTAADAPQQEQPEPEQAAPQWSDEDADEARLFGWKSPDEWQGEKPAGYIDNPEEFLDRVKRSRIFSTMSEKLEAQEREARETARRMEAMNKTALERQKRQFEAEMSTITQQQRVAVENADAETFDRLEKRREDLMKDQPQAEAPQQSPAQPDPFVAQYSASEEGKWVTNPVLRQTGAQLIDANPAMHGATAEQQIKYAEGELRKMYPAYFPQPEAPQPKPKPRAAVDPGGLAGGAAKGSSTFAKLPADAKAQFKRFVDEGLFENTKKDQESYANDYNAA